MLLWKKVLVCVLGIQLLGNASGLVTFLSVDGWYDALQKPVGTPPNGTFGPVWLAVYTMMGVALALIWDARADGLPKRRALRCFAIQFALNVLWTPVFFGLQRIDWALCVIVPLLLVIGLTMVAAWPIRRLASLLLVPYFIWVSYATYLNFGFWVLNR